MILFLFDGTKLRLFLCPDFQFCNISFSLLHFLSLKETFSLEKGTSKGKKSYLRSRNRKNMTKEETQQLKGIAILMMVWLHLFGTNQEILDGCEKYIYLWNGDPLIYAMRKFARMCVVFYTFLGGYGLCKVWQRDNGNLKSQPSARRSQTSSNLRRVWRLMVNYWLVLLLFVGVAWWLHPETYPGGWNEFLKNLTALDCSYNDTLWFLLPYALLTLLAAPIMRLVMGLRGKWLWIFLVAAFAVKAVIYVNETTYTSWLGLIGQNLLAAMGLFFMFAVGALFAKNELMERVVATIRGWVERSFVVRRMKVSPSVVCLVLLLLLFFGRICVGASTLIDPPFLLLMIPVYLCIRRPQWLSGTLAFVGKHSTNIWFTHRYILVLTGTLITALHYPIVMLMVLVGVCIVCSYVVKGLMKLLRL